MGEVRVPVTIQNWLDLEKIALGERTEPPRTVQTEALVDTDALGSRSAASHESSQLNSRHTIVGAGPVRSLRCGYPDLSARKPAKQQARKPALRRGAVANVVEARPAFLSPRMLASRDSRAKPSSAHAVTKPVAHARRQTRHDLTEHPASPSNQAATFRSAAE